MSYIGSLYGMEVHTDENVVERKLAFKRKQTRKFKNHRWVKKYRKKYSYAITRPSMIQIHEKLLIHPKAWEFLQTKINENNFRQNGKLQCRKYK